MRVDDLPIALLAFLAFVVVAPLWVRFQGSFTAATPEGGFLAALVLPAMAGLFVLSWVSTELARVALGGFLFVAMMVMAPWWFRFIDLVSGGLTSSPLTQFILQLAVPVLFLLFLVNIGRRRLLEVAQ